MTMAVSACSFEPPVHLPAGPGKSGYTAGKAPHKVSSGQGKQKAPQTLAYGQEMRTVWWRLFHSHRLDKLIHLAIQHNPTLNEARAQLLKAQAVASIDESAFYPQLKANLGAQRSRAALQLGNNRLAYRYSLFTGGVDVSYYPDIFGVNRMVYNGGRAQVEYQRYQLQAAGLSLSGNVVAAAIGEASVQAQINATKKIIRQEQQLLKLTQTQYQAGSVSQLNVVNQQAQLASSISRLPPLKQKLAVYRHEMAILVGQFPSKWHEKPFKLNELTLPKHIPVSLPSTLVKQRPDVQAAERQIRYAAALVGESRAEFYPLVQLTGSFGYNNNVAHLLFNPVSEVWSLAASLVQPIFEGGKLDAQEKEAKAVFEADFSNYRATVLGAFEQVADSLRAMQNDASALSAQRQAFNAAHRALQMSQYQYSTGQVDFLSLLASEVQYDNARIAYIKAKAQRYQDTASLLIALGGGWWHQPIKAGHVKLNAVANGHAS